MEEASLDHGLDRLPFFFSVSILIGLLTLLFSAPSLATTFGPIPVAEQVKNVQYVVRGRIVGAPWVEEERKSRRPYTHWKLQVVETAKGEGISGEVTIRERGGEMNGMGYHVAGSATFRDGEEVFVNLADTDIPAVKEVMGLASGKYTFERGASGKQVLRSGLGFVLKSENGNDMSPDEFLALVRRVGEGQETEGDRNIFVNKGNTHAHGNEPPHATHTETPRLKSPTVVGLMSPPPEERPSPAPISESSLQESPSPAEESTGSPAIWIFAAVGGIALILAVFLLFRR